MTKTTVHCAMCWADTAPTGTKYPVCPPCDAKVKSLPTTYSPMWDKN